MKVRCTRTDLIHNKLYYTSITEGMNYDVVETGMINFMIRCDRGDVRSYPQWMFQILPGAELVQSETTTQKT
jgi:hypothetical protein